MRILCLKMTVHIFGSRKSGLQCCITVDLGRVGFAKENVFVIAGSFSDHALSGSSIGRLQLLL